MSTRLARLGFAVGFACVIASFMMHIACGSSSPPPAPTPGPSTTFQGTIAGGAGLTAMSGTVSVTVQAQIARAITPRFGLPFVATVYAQGTSVSATGTVHATGDSQRPSLSGTFDSSTKALNLTGVGYAFTGTIANGQMSGTFTAPFSASGTFSGLNSTTATVTTYCGTFNGSQSGVWNFAVSSTGQVAGEVVQTGKSGLLLTGQVNGSTVTFTVLGTPTGTATGTIQGGSVNGTWSAGIDGGTFAGSANAC